MLRGQLKEEKEQREKVEMQLKEMSKLSGSGDASLICSPKMRIEKR